MNERAIREFVSDMRMSGDLADSTLTEYERSLRQVPFELPGDRRAVRDWLAQGSFTPHRRYWHVRALKRYARWYADEHGVADPLAALKHIKLEESPPQRIARDDDLQRVWKHLFDVSRSSLTNARNYALFLVARDSGMRRGELANLRLDDIDLEAGRLLIRRSKTGKPRYVPLSHAASVATRRYLRRRAASPRFSAAELWISERGVLTGNGIYQVFVTASKAVGVDPLITPHQLRRRMAHKWGEYGLGDDTLRLVCGWTDGRMVARYRAELAADRAVADFRTVVGDREPTERRRRRRRRPRPSTAAE